MSKFKVIICCWLLSIVIFTLLFIAALIEIYDDIAYIITGIWVAEKLQDFYHWLRKDT